MFPQSFSHVAKMAKQKRMKLPQNLALDTSQQKNFTKKVDDLKKNVSIAIPQWLVLNRVVVKYGR